ncbi:hypothetical protein UCRPA7_6151 [Phaeoacremonium minimum UCRPA7]|uniref:Uncharacterized protein n=1 Tax=Phaeoacremonium minimum (strain UCR-PA7) TaxID=1286976 RepID=R8BGA0_PHAM7|nr:hypothetical protein UCRPA7_6151 [Phaeoacremonium minimum UCRPA7]EON98331.1 hypothetical protein UCRPA7_6151 [Phaeoacremonium minimum UCRPA7]
MSSTATTPSVEELRELDVRAQAFIPEAAEHTPHTFLSLAPLTSNSYPKAPQPTKRRTSSQSSNGGAARMRVLKLAPVHYGEHAGDHKGDWHEVAIE